MATTIPPTRGHLPLITQPMSRPETWAEFEAVKAQMIDTHGNPLVSSFCTACRTNHFTVEPCVSEVPCPDCGSVKTRCIRPSEHDAAEWHVSRIAAFDELRDEREAAGHAQVALWPQGSPGGLLDLLPDYELSGASPSTPGT